MCVLESHNSKVCYHKSETSTFNIPHHSYYIYYSKFLRHKEKLKELTSPVLSH